MDLDPVILPRIQFAFVVSFHIIFLAVTIGLATWLAVLEGMHLATGQHIYRRVFEFWMKVFAMPFGMGVVTVFGMMYWPYRVPYSITAADAAAPEASLGFLFRGAGLFVLPVIAIYTIAVYWIFRGKTRPTH